MKTALRTQRLGLVDREKNIQGLADLGWMTKDVADLLPGLTVADYAEGPLPDRQGRNEDHWVFGPSVGGRQFYVKVTRVTWGVKVLSLHPAEHPLRPPPE